MAEWKLNPDRVSMTLWEDHKPRAIIEQRMGLNLTTGEYYLVPNQFHVLFYKEYFNDVGSGFDDNLRVFIPRSFEFEDLAEAVQSVDKYINYTFPINVHGFVSEPLQEFIDNQHINKLIS